MQAEIEYHNLRERMEREAAANAKHDVAQSRHVELAERHAARAAQLYDGIRSGM